MALSGGEPRDSEGTPLTGRTVTTSVTDASVLGLDGNTVTALADGSARVLRECDGRQVALDVIVVGEPPPPPPPDDSFADLLASVNAVTEPNDWDEAPGVLEWVFDMEDAAYREMDGANVIGLWDTSFTHMAVLAPGYTTATVTNGRITAGLYLPASAGLTSLAETDGLFVGGLFDVDDASANFNATLGALVPADGTGTTHHFGVQRQHPSTVDGRTQDYRVVRILNSYLRLRHLDFTGRPLWQYMAWMHPGVARAGGTGSGTNMDTPDSHMVMHASRDFRVLAEDGLGTAFPEGKGYDLWLAPRTTDPVPEIGGQSVANGTTLGPRFWVLGRRRLNREQNKRAMDWLVTHYDAWEPDGRDLVMLDGNSYAVYQDLWQSVDPAREATTDCVNYSISGIQGVWLRSSARLLHNELDHSARIATDNVVVKCIWEYLNEGLPADLADAHTFMRDWRDRIMLGIPDTHGGCLTATVPNGPNTMSVGTPLRDFNDWCKTTAITEGTFDGCALLWESVTCDPENYNYKSPFYWWYFEESVGSQPYDELGRAITRILKVEPSAQNPGHLGYYANQVVLKEPTDGVQTYIDVHMDPGGPGAAYKLGGKVESGDRIYFGAARVSPQIADPGDYLVDSLSEVGVTDGMPDGELRIHLTLAPPAMAAGTVVNGWQRFFRDGHPRADNTNAGPWADAYAEGIDETRDAVLARRAA